LEKAVSLLAGRNDFEVIKIPVEQLAMSERLSAK
jgi:hypothetical protein